MAKDKLDTLGKLIEEVLEEKTALEARLVRIHNRLNDLNMLAGSKKRGRKAKVAGGETPIPRGKGKRGRRKGKMTTNEAILKALEGGQLDVPTITEKVNALKGKVSKASINQSLGKLKKASEIGNPSRGQYVLKK